MPDKKISQLTAASTPLVGTEVAPIIQSNATVKATVDSFTSGRALTPLSVTQNGKSVPYSILNNGIPFVLPSSGTIGNNGALSAITATNVAHPHAYVWVPGNAISTGSASGWYYAQFSSTTAATLYNNTYTSGVPTVPASPTAFVTTGPGAYTQFTAADITAISIPLEANIIGVSGSLDVTCSASVTSNGNAKFLRVALDSAATPFITVAPIDIGYVRVLGNLISQGVTNRQMSSLSSTVGFLNLGNTTASAGQNSALSFDMTTTHNLLYTVRIVTATDTMTLVTAQANVTK